MAARVRHVPNVIPLNRIQGFHFYNQLYEDAQKQFINAIVPRPLTQSEIENDRKETFKLIDRIRELEAVVEANQHREGQYDHDLFVARVNYRLRFPRTFRINDLPVEVLANIFRLLSWAAPDPKSSVNWRLWLTWVCRLWREVALADSTIWNAIWFRDPPFFERAFEWFRRSGSTPLDIRISDTSDYKFSVEVFLKIIDRLFTKIRQIRALIIVCEGKMQAQIAFEKLQILAKLEGPVALERIELHSTGTYAVQIGDVKVPTPLFGGVFLPTLKHITLNNIILDWRKSYLTNLTTLDMRRMMSQCPDIHQFRSILASSPNLSKLCLDGMSPQFRPEEIKGLKPITLPNLKTLVYGSYRLAVALFVAMQIHAPNVRFLTLWNFVNDDFAPFFAFMTGRFPNLRILHLCSVETVASSKIVSWLTSMPGLLYLRVSSIQPYLFNFFLRPPDPALVRQVPKGLEHIRVAESIVCPRLDILDLHNIDVNSALSWVIQRTRLGYPIRKIYISTALSQQMSQAQHDKFSEFALVFRLDPGARTHEEDCLMSI